jgi:hypothetical protein
VLPPALQEFQRSADRCGATTTDGFVTGQIARPAGALDAGKPAHLIRWNRHLSISGLPSTLEFDT